MEKEINGKKYTINIISYVQGLEVEDARQKEGVVSATKKMLTFSTGLSDEEILKLNIKEGIELQKIVNKVNETDFQDPVEEPSRS